MATLIDEKGLQHYADKMVKAENRKVGTKSLPTALTEIDAMIDSMKGKFEQTYGDALEKSFENQENTFKIGAGVGEDRSETVEDGFISIDKLEGKTLVNRLKGENKTVQLPHRIELDEMIIKPNTDYTFQSTNESAVASFKQPKYKKVVFKDGIKLEENLDVDNKIEFRGVEGQTLKNIVPNPVNFKNWTETRGAVTKGNACIKIQATEATLTYGNGLSEININNLFKSNATYTISFDYRTGGENIHNILISRWSPHTAPIGQYPPSSGWKTVKHTFTIGASDTNLHYLCFYIIPKENGVSLDYWGEIRNFVILEGDYTQKEVPSFIEGVQGVGRKSRNLFNKNAIRIEDGVQMLWDTGSTRVLEGFYTTDFIEIKPNTTYSLSGLTYASDARMVTFDENKTGIREKARCYENITTKNNSRFIRICAKKENDIIPIDKIQLEESTRATHYEPYWDGYKIGVKTHGKNLIGTDGLFSGWAYSGQPIRRGEIGIRFKAKPNTKYTVSYRVVNKEVYSKRGVFHTTEDYPDIGVVVGEVDITTSYRKDGDYEIFTFTTPQNTKYIFGYLGLAGNNPAENMIDNLRVEEGDGSASYEPYKESLGEVILLDQLQGIGDVRDRLYFDGGYQIEKKFKEISLADDTFERSSYTDEKMLYVYSTKLHTGIKKPLNNATCNKLRVYSTEGTLNANKNKGITMYTREDNVLIGLDIQQDLKGVATVEQATKWIKENDIKLIVELATPQIVDIQTKEQIKLDTYQPTYFIVDSGVAPRKTIIDIPILEQVTGKNGMLRTPATLDRVYLDIQGSGKAQEMRLFEGLQKGTEYIETIRSVGESPIKIHSLQKNLYNSSKPPKLNSGVVTVIEDGFRLELSSEKRDSYQIIKDFPFSPNTTYTLSYEVRGKMTNGEYCIGCQTSTNTMWWNPDLVILGGRFENLSETSFTKHSRTFNTLSTKTELVLAPKYYDSGSGWVEFRNIQIEVGSKATPYEPHKEVFKTIALKEPLRGLPGGIKDTIENVGGEWKIIRRCCEKTFNGEESWDVNGINPNSKQSQEIFYSSFDRPCLKDSSEGIGTGFISQGGPYNVDFECLSAYKSGLYVRIEKSKLEAPTSEGFKKWLTSNPITVVYPLATPTVEPLSPITLQAWKGGTLLIEDPINVASTHTVALNKPGQILKNIEELTILRDRVEKLEANYDQLALEQAHQLALTKQSIELDYEI